MEYEFDEDTIQKAFGNSPDGIKELLRGSDITEDIILIGKKHSLTDDDVAPIVQELGYILLGLKDKKSNYSEFISEKIKDNLPDSFSRDITEYIKTTYDKALRFVPIETKKGDTAIFTAENANDFFVTEDYFRIRMQGDFPHSYVRSADIIYMSGFNELGLSSSIGFIILALIIGAISMSLIALMNFFGIAIGALGLWGAWGLLKSPFRKSRPEGLIEFHPNLNLKSINLRIDGVGLSDDDIVDGIKAIRKYITY